MIEIIGCILLIIIGVSFICMSVMLDKLEGTCQDCIYLEKIKPLFEKLEKENKILRENEKHNDKVVDKVNWENQLLKQENKKYKEVINKAIEYINKCENIKAYYEYIDEDGYDEYNYDEDFKKELLDILKEVKTC